MAVYLYDLYKFRAIEAIPWDNKSVGLSSIRYLNFDPIFDIWKRKECERDREGRRDKKDP